MIAERFKFHARVQKQEEVVADFWRHCESSMNTATSGLFEGKTSGIVSSVVCVVRQPSGSC